MREVTGNLWTFNPVSDPLVVRCITTNGYIKSDGRAVMGRGCALEATKLIPTLPLVLGTHLKKRGNVIMGPLKFSGSPATYGGESPIYNILTFPVKYSWEQDADIHLIRQSAEELIKIATKRRELVFVLPRPGCGNGRLKWEHVKQWLRNLPDNVYVIDKEAKV